MDKLQKIFTVKNLGESEFHSGCNYRKDNKGFWCIGTKMYVTEALEKVKEILHKPNLEEGNNTLGQEPTPMSESFKPVLNQSELLSAKGHRKFQQLVGIAQWLITCGWFDISFAVISINRFSSVPLNRHMKVAVRIFKYLNKTPECRIRIDPSKN